MEVGIAHPRRDRDAARFVTDVELARIFVEQADEPVAAHPVRRRVVRRIVGRIERPGQRQRRDRRVAEIERAGDQRGALQGDDLDRLVDRAFAVIAVGLDRQPVVALIFAVEPVKEAFGRLVADLARGGDGAVGVARDDHAIIDDTVGDGIVAGRQAEGEEILAPPGLELRIKRVGGNREFGRDLELDRAVEAEARTVDGELFVLQQHRGREDAAAGARVGAAQEIVALERLRHRRSAPPRPAHRPTIAPAPRAMPRLPVWPMSARPALPE
jgi:hypothetical protein